MDRLKHIPVFFVLLPLCALLAGGGFWLARLQAQVKRDLGILAQKEQERAWLVRQTPAPSESNAHAISVELSEAQKAFAAWRTVLQGGERGLLASPPPAKSIDAYFELAAFVEKTRTLAGRGRVLLKPDERFGFATYANEGPEPELLPAVHRQRLLIQYLVETLLGARPRELLLVQREHPLNLAQRSTRRNHAAAATETAVSRVNEAAADFFAPDERLSLCVAGLVDDEFYRVEFTGQTPALRAFLNKLAAFELPLVVRNVEVEPLAAPAPGAAPASVPVVTSHFSKFAVVVEFVEVLPMAVSPSS